MTDKERGIYSKTVTYLGVGIVLIITIISIAFFTLFYSEMVSFCSGMEVGRLSTPSSATSTTGN
jgi:hypothetical protein